MRVGTVFSGIEAPIQALNQMGISHDHLFSCEINPNAISSIEANYAPYHLFHDITKVRPCDYPKVDLFITGYPCQDISVLTTKTVYNGTQSRLVVHALDYIQVHKPSIVILENVANLSSEVNTPFFNGILTRLYNLRYKVRYFKLNSAKLGSPQIRNRFWMVAVLDKAVLDKLDTLLCTPLTNIHNKSVYDILESGVSEKYYYNGLTLERLIKSVQFKYEGVVAGTITKGVFAKRPDDKATCLDANYAFPVDNAGQRTIIGEFSNGIKFRKFTPRECLRLQNFGEDFKIVVKDSELYRQAGNTMNVLSLKYLYSGILPNN